VFMGIITESEILLYLYGGFLNYKSSSPQFIWDNSIFYSII
jgi:hypothetical protein